MNGSSARAREPVSLDAADYNPVDHLNLLFATAPSVSSLNRVSSGLRARGDALGSEVAALEASQAYGTDSSLERMQSAQADLGRLFGKIETIRARAIQTEQTITSMTADIKRLDGTKRNLTLSMTALKRLQMLTTAYEQLRALSKARQYRECAGLLQAVLQLMRHFNSYRSIGQIATLSRAVSDLQRGLLEQVCEDFELAFSRDEVAARRGLLVEACLVADALGETARARLTTWYVNTMLREYRQVFRGSDEAGSLDNIGRRYGWFRRTIKTYEDEHAVIFPPSWHAAETLAAAFCDGTREDFCGILERSTARRTDPARLDVNLLLNCLQETLEFEQHLERRLAPEPRASIDTVSSAGCGGGGGGGEDRPHTFSGSISAAFEPYLSLWVEAQDRQLAAKMPEYRKGPLIPPDEEFSPSAVIPSAIELCHFYKVTLSHCARLSTGDRLLDLSRVFAKHLDEYAEQVLFHILKGGGGGAQGHAPLQNIVLVLNTAHFWETNTAGLEGQIRKRIDPDLGPKVDLSSQVDNFVGVAMTAITALVRYVDGGLEPAWREMRNLNWAGLETVGDQSSYVAELLSQLNRRAGEVMAAVVKRDYALSFCNNLVEHLSTAYIGNVVQCRPICEVGAEQMLLDKYVISKSLEGLLSHHDAGGGPAGPPPPSFVKRVNQSMSRVDPLLKTLQVRPSPPEGLVQAYLIHIADRSEVNFKKILEIKGIRRQDQNVLTELFAIHRDGPSSAGGGGGGAGRNLVESSPLLMPLMSGSGGGSGGGGLAGAAAGLSSGTAGGLAGLGTVAAGGVGRTFDAAMLGERLLSAAREMGDKAAAGGDKATINENLKSIGKFFRSDFGGLGARFGKRDVSGGGSVGDQGGGG